MSFLSEHKVYDILPMSDINIVFQKDLLMLDACNLFALHECRPALI